MSFEQWLAAATVRVDDMDLSDSVAYLDSLERDDLKAAKDWFVKRGNTWVRNEYWQLDWNRSLDRDDSALYLTRRSRGAWLVALCTIRWCGGTDAAKRVPWGDFWSTDYKAGPALAATEALRRDRAWAERFVDTASNRRASSAAWGNWHLSSLVRTLVEHHGLPCPTGAGFLAGWRAGTPRQRARADELAAGRVTGYYDREAGWVAIGSQDRSFADLLADELAEDPLMPDLLWNYLSVGFAGETPGLPAAIGKLVDRGVIERGDVLERGLSLLTAAQRPKSTKALTQILTVVDLKPDEIPGGLVFMLGVLATVHTSATKALFPHALALVADADGLDELTRTVVSRPEKHLKVALLNAVVKGEQPGGLVTRIGAAAALDTLALLAGGDDAAFIAKVARAAGALTARYPGLAPASDAAEHAGAAVAPMGLWDALPTPTGDQPPSWVREWPHWANRNPSAVAALGADVSGRGSFVSPWYVDHELTEMRDGTWLTQKGGATELVSAAQELLAKGELSLATMHRILEALFLAGGLSQAWHVALEIANLACAVPRAPAKLADLLRMLAGYAGEVPRPYPVPVHIARLAGSDTKTKAQMEATQLVAALGGPDGESATATEHAHDQANEHPNEQADKLVQRRGLWATSVAEARLLSPAPSQVRLDQLAVHGRPIAEDLVALRSAITGGGVKWYDENISDVRMNPPGHADDVGSRLTTPDRILDEIVHAVAVHGAGQVKAALRGVTTSHAHRGLVEAVAFWVEGPTNAEWFWQLAHDTMTHQEYVDWHRDANPHLNDREFPRFIHDIVDKMPPLTETLTELLTGRIASDRLVRPRAATDDAVWFEMLRILETLLLAERTVPLSTPTYADCTLDLDDLLARLETLVGRPDALVGPMDLVQALHRVRPEPALADRVGDVDRLRELRPADAGPLATAADLTSRDGLEKWDVLAEVTTWVRAGGVAPLNPQVVDQRWVTDVVSPVPFDRLHAAPAWFHTRNWALAEHASNVAARILPLWPDRIGSAARVHATGFHPAHIPGLMAGTFGLPTHDRLLQAAQTTVNGHENAVQCVLADFALRGRLDPTTLAQAAVDRHTAGTMKLAPIAAMFRESFQGRDLYAGRAPAALHGLWPATVAMAAALSAEKKGPYGLPELLRLLTDYVIEVPAELAAVPDEIRALAGQSGTTKAHLEARVLVATFERHQADDMSPQEPARVGAPQDAPHDTPEGASESAVATAQEVTV
jgi:hypothetical protein